MAIVRVMCVKCGETTDTKALKSSRGKCSKCRGSRFRKVMDGQVCADVYDGDSLIDDVTDFVVAAAVIESLTDSYDEPDDVGGGSYDTDE